MNSIKQPELYHIGIEKFDDEHQQLVTMVNDIHALTDDNQKNRNIQKQIITSLVKLARAHFAGEEEHMRRQKYPDLDKHHQCHRIIYAQLLDLERRFASTSGPVHNHALQFLYNWLDEHILTEDKQYADYSLKAYT
jgi:hemerythrin-like metal-binding protein